MKIPYVYLQIEQRLLEGKRANIENPLHPTYYAFRFFAIFHRQEMLLCYLCNLIHPTDIKNGKLLREHIGVWIRPAYDSPFGDIASRRLAR